MTQRLRAVAAQQEILRERLEALFAELQQSIDCANRALALWCSEPHDTAEEDDHDR